VDKDYVGRIFIAPENEDPNNSIVYVNLGTTLTGGQMIPKYNQLLSSICSQAEYDKAMSDIVNVMAAHSHTFCCVFCSMLICMQTMGVLSCGLCYLASEMRATLAQGKEALSKHSFRCESAELKCIQSAKQTPLTLETQSWDSNGVLCQATFGAKHNRRTRPSWPPLGYNVVFTVKGPELRNSWPRGGTMMGQPAIMQVPAVVSAAVVVPSAPQMMDRGAGGSGGGATDLAAQLRSLDDLRRQGVLSDSDFEAAKRKLLSS
jgi:hypothetical protein